MSYLTYTEYVRQTVNNTARVHKDPAPIIRGAAGSGSIAAPPAAQAFAEFAEFAAHAGNWAALSRAANRRR